MALGGSMVWLFRLAPLCPRTAFHDGYVASGRRVESNLPAQQSLPAPAMLAESRVTNAPTGGLPPSRRNPL